jgi:SNF2 family DNA or RNA helicase
MEISQDGENIQIIARGIEYLRIKAEMSKYLHNSFSFTKNTIVFPLSCIDIVNTYIPQLNSLLSEINNPYSEHAVARIKALDSIENKLNNNIPSEWGEILDIHQQYAVDAMVTPNLLGICLFDEQGSGKTVMSIAAFDILKKQNDVDSMIVVCPKSMISGWDNDINKLLPNKYQISLVVGDKDEKRKAALNTFDILILNYESLETILIPLTAIIKTKNILLVVDESYYTKNEKAIRSSFVYKFRLNCKRCFVLCGTPAPNSPYDIINQFNIADKKYTFSSFQPSDDIEQDKIIISDLISQRGTFIRRLKTEILTDVPKKCFHIITVPLTGYQKFIYEKAKNNLELELKTYDNKIFRKNMTTYFQKRAALLQICSIPSNIDPTFSETPAKYLKLDILLDELLSQNRKIIIWSSYKASIQEIKTRYSIYQPMVIDGSSTADEKKEIVSLFQNEETKNILIANPGAAGAGITLHASYDAIYISYTNQAAHYLQSLDRIHRRGQKSKTVNYYLFICEGTIEETEVVRLRRRELQQHELLGDTYIWPTSLDEAISELTGDLFKR